jgi:2-keto-4-pentenoate hydratase/2-oxohepta-3-ene-1,7-dioic acid hydratase in catechol pathway
MRLAAMDYRAVIADEGGELAVELPKRATAGSARTSSSSMTTWQAFSAWAATADLGGEHAGPLRRAGLQAPSTTPVQVFAIGLNYRDHADESGLAHPDVPPTFTKFVSSFAGPRAMLAADPVATCGGWAGTTPARTSSGTSRIPRATSPSTTPTSTASSTTHSGNPAPSREHALSSRKARLQRPRSSRPTTAPRS